MKKKKVMITGAGGPAAVSFLRAVCGEDGFEFYMGDIDRCAAGLYLVSEERREILLRGDNPDFVDHLLGFCRKFKIDVLVPTVDSELLPIARSVRKFEELGVKVVLADKKTLEKCLDKHMLFNLCRDFVPLPASELLDDEFDARGLTYPRFVKPRSGSGSSGILRIDKVDDLNGLKRDGSLLIQEYLPGAEYSVDVLANRDGEVLAAVPRERLKIDSGIAVTGRSVKNEKLETLAKVVAERICLKFAANIQFKISEEGEPCLLEVNPRFPGTMPLTVASGVNMPLFALRDALGLDNSGFGCDWEEKVMVRTWQEHYIRPEEFESASQVGSRRTREIITSAEIPFEPLTAELAHIMVA